MKPFLPIISISPFLEESSDDDKQSVANDIKRAMLKYGAFYVKIDFDEKLIFEQAKLFFESKEKYDITIKKGGFSRGYIPFGAESGSDLIKVKEAFAYGYDWRKDKLPTNTLQGPNVFPASLPSFKRTMDSFYCDMVKVSQALTSAFSRSLGIDLNDHCKEGDTISLMRLFHYFPKMDSDDGKKRIGSSEHTDWGFLTLILQQQGVVGLQIFSENVWEDVIPLEGTLLVNGGDYLSLLTSGKYISPLHRVVSSPNERFSFVFFYYPNFDAKIPACEMEKDISLFKDQNFGDLKKKMEYEVTKVSFGKYIEEKWNQVYRNNKTY